MKATGIVRKIDDLGRFIIPIELRRSLGIELNDPMEVFVDGENIILRRYRKEEISNKRIIEDLKNTLSDLGENEALEVIDTALEIMKEKKNPCHDFNY